MTLLERLRVLQQKFLSTFSRVSEHAYRKQLHPDLSPIGWHLGHCIFTEDYWIKEKLLDHDNINDQFGKFYNPDLSPKHERGEALPPKDELITWAKQRQTNNRTLIESLPHQTKRDSLLKNNFITHFLIQHYAQHYETMMIGLRRHIAHDSVTFKEMEKLKPTVVAKDTKLIPAGRYNVGAIPEQCAYDNEYPAHSVQLPSYRIATRPVNNGEYLQFILDGGYTQRQYWSEAGWQWCNQGQLHPEHWRYKTGIWYSPNHYGAIPLDTQATVYGVCYFEAQAFAKWADARLPHEHEWEIAHRLGRLSNVYQVWEWCDNAFFPYKGFNPFPYSGYSVPYFDDQHYTLKGGSQYTQAAVKRSSFRNYYLPNKRHQLCGFRLVFSEV